MLSRLGLADDTSATLGSGYLSFFPASIGIHDWGCTHDGASDVVGRGPGMLKYACTDGGVQLIMPRECATDAEYCEGEIEFPSQVSRSGVCRCRAQILLSGRYTSLGRYTARYSFLVVQELAEVGLGST